MISRVDHPTTGLERAASPQTRLGELLVRRGLITEKQLAAGLKRQQETAPRMQLGQILIQQGYAKAEDVVNAVADLVTVPYLLLTPEMIQGEPLSKLPKDFLEQHNLLPVSLHDRVLTIAVEEFTNVFLIEEIKRMVNCEVVIVAATPENIRQTRDAAFRTQHALPREPRESNDGLRELLDEISVDELKVVDQNQGDADEDLAAEAADSPVVKLVNYVIKTAVDSRASDIHIEPDLVNFRVRFRVDGELTDVVRPSARLLPAVVSRIKIMAGMDISERRLPQDGGMTITLADRPIDLRVSTMTTKFGEKVAMRLIDREADVRTLSDLGLEPEMLRRLRRIISMPSGMVLVTGPTGSGKTTTLYAVLSEITSDRRNISTVEDPVERRLRSANQFQIAPAAGFTFARALRSLLRQDPDIIMVGEIRDSETAKLATEAALTGHLVLTTLHTSDAPTAVPRLANMGVEPYLIAASLRGALAQRLVRKICPKCRTPGTISAAEHEALSIAAGEDVHDLNPFIGAGCEFCRNAGYVGRTGVFELLTFDEESLASIAHDPSIRNVRHVARHTGLITLAQDGIAKVSQGIISVPSLLEIVSYTPETESNHHYSSPMKQKIAA